MYFHHYRHCIIFISSSSIHHDVLFIHIFKIYKSSYRDQITWCRSKDGDWVVGTTVGNNKKGVHLRLLSMLLLLSLWLLLSWLLSCCCHCHCCCCCCCRCHCRCRCHCHCHCHCRCRCRCRCRCHCHYNYPQASQDFSTTFYQSLAVVTTCVQVR